VLLFERMEVVLELVVPRVQDKYLETQGRSRDGEVGKRDESSDPHFGGCRFSDLSVCGVAVGTSSAGRVVSEELFSAFPSRAVSSCLKERSDEWIDQERENRLSRDTVDVVVRTMVKATIHARKNNDV